MNGEVVAVWTHESTHWNTSYTTLLRSDGELTCDCPGWVYQRKGQERGCKHTRMVTEQAKWRLVNGQAVPETYGATRPKVKTAGTVLLKPQAAKAQEVKVEPATQEKVRMIRFDGD